MSGFELKKVADIENHDGWITVSYLEDLVLDAGTSVLFNHRQVALFYIGKPPTIYAIANFDPFSQANVLSKGILSRLNNRLVVASPIFRQHFSLETGQCCEDEHVVLETFQARVSGNRVQLYKAPDADEP